MSKIYIDDQQEGNSNKTETEKDSCTILLPVSKLSNDKNKTID